MFVNHHNRPRLSAQKVCQINSNQGHPMKVLCLQGEKQKPICPPANPFLPLYSNCLVTSNPLCPLIRDTPLQNRSYLLVWSAPLLISLLLSSIPSQSTHATPLLSPPPPSFETFFSSQIHHQAHSLETLKRIEHLKNWNNSKVIYFHNSWLIIINRSQVQLQKG